MKQLKLPARSFSLPPAAMSVTLVTYLALTIGLAFVMPLFPALGLIGAVVVNVVALLFFRPDFALIVYVLVASPSVALSLGSGILSRLYIGNVLFALVVVIWVLRVVLPERKAGRPLLDRTLSLPLAGLIIFGLISIIYSRLFPDPNVPYQFPHSTVSLTVVNAAEMALLVGLPMFLTLVPGVVRTARRAYAVVIAYVAVGLLYALGAIFAGPLNLYSKQVILGVRRPMVFGAVSSALGSLILLFGCLAFCQALYAVRLRSRLIWSGLSLVFCIGIIVTFGRESWIGMFLAVLLMVAFRTRNWSVLLVLLIPPILLLMPGVSDFFDPAKTYGSDRFKIWQDAIMIWQHSPYFGVGAGNFQFFDRVYGNDSVGVAHNQYLQMLAETGMQGLLCLVWLMVAVGYKAVKSFKEAKTRLSKSIALAYLGFYVSVVFAGFFTGSFIPSAAAGGGTGPFVEASYRWMLLGLVLSIPMWEKDAAERERPVNPTVPKERERLLLRVKSKAKTGVGRQ
jgi:O-antigen ligase